MEYNSFDELKANYPDKEDMSFDELVSFVQDSFDTYEKFGFNKKFHSPYEDKQDYVGMGFKVLNRLSYANGDADLECLPMWKIELENGTVIDAYPEEICIAETKDFVDPVKCDYLYALLCEPCEDLSETTFKIECYEIKKFQSHKTVGSEQFIRRMLGDTNSYPIVNESVGFCDRITNRGRLIAYFKTESKVDAKLAQQTFVLGFAYRMIEADKTLNELKAQIQKEENEKNLILGIMPHLKEDNLGGITYPTI